MITIAEVKKYLTDQDLVIDDITDKALVISVSGEAKFRINVAMSFGEHSFRIESFVS